jgi:hypothetical protein
MTQPHRHSGNLPWGFFFGPAVVNRLWDHTADIGIEIETKRETVTIRVTKTGKIIVGKPSRKRLATTSRDFKQ